MYLIFDNLAAMMISGAIIMIFVTVSYQGQEEIIESTRSSTLREQQLAFVEILTKDIRGMTGAVNIEEDENDNTFTFYSRVGEDTTTQVITYKRKIVGSHEGEELFRIERYVEDRWSGIGSTRDGGSAGMISEWSIEARNRDGQKPAEGKTDEVEQIFVKFEMVSPYDIDSNENVIWNTTFRPNQLHESENL